jgi:hypothetical protein
MKQPRILYEKVSSCNDCPHNFGFRCYHKDTLRYIENSEDEEFFPSWCPLPSEPVDVLALLDKNATDSVEPAEMATSLRNFARRVRIPLLAGLAPLADISVREALGQIELAVLAMERAAVEQAHALAATRLECGQITKEFDALCDFEEEGTREGEDDGLPT